MEILQILYTFLYKYGVGPPFALSTAAILGMDSYKLNSLMEFYTILLQEHLQVASEMLEVGICFSLWPPKLTRVWFNDFLLFASCCVYYKGIKTLNMFNLQTQQCFY
jgi:hypothetical protein